LQLARSGVPIRVPWNPVRMTTLLGLSVDEANAIGTLIAALAALLVLAGSLRAWYRRTLGRRRDRYDRLARLGTGAQHGFFVAVLGEPPAMRRVVVKEDYREWLASNDPRFREGLEESQYAYVEKHFTESIFIDRDYYVQTISDDDETVLAFSVTIRHSRFRPVFELPPRVGWRERRHWKRRTGEKFKPLFRVRLGRTRFSELDRGDYEDLTGPHFKASIGARSFWYSEIHSYGNPGYYQTFVFTSSSVSGVPDGIRNLSGAIQEAGGEEWPDPDRDDQPDWKQMPKAQSFRRRAAITTLTILSLGLSVENYPATFGPHGDEVRTLP
jgi:hypothetical protein